MLQFIHFSSAACWFGRFHSIQDLYGFSTTVGFDTMIHGKYRIRYPGAPKASGKTSGINKKGDVIKMTFKNVSILLPAMDETYSLEQTVDTIWDTCKPEDIAEFIIILCERTSKECRDTAEQLVQRYQDKTSIYIHDQVKPFAGGAVQEGFDLAKGSHVIMMASDLETPPPLVQRYIELAKVGPGKVITASRWIKGGGFKGYNKVKLVCNIIFEKTIALFFGVRLSDLTYGYRCLPTELVQNIAWEELKHPFFLETALKPIRLGVKFIEVPAQWEARTEGVSQNSFFANFKYFKTAWHVRFMPKDKILRSQSRK